MSGERALCLFAGLGATAKGQRDIGNEIAGVVDYWDPAIETLELNFPKSKVQKVDVKSIDDFSGLWREVGVLLGGPPCQPFSQASQTGIADADPRDCIPDFIRAVKDLRPRLFIMEEVKTLTYKKNAHYFATVLGALRALGYEVEWKVLDMSLYGVPQSRKRLFIVGRNDGQPVAWPLANLGWRPTMARALDWDHETARARAHAAPGEYAAPYWVFDRPSTTVVGSFRPDVQAAPGYRKAGDPPRQNTPGSVVITLEEALVLQGLPRDWKLSGTEAQKRLQIGNTCPPTMTAQITLANDPQEATS